MKDGEDMLYILEKNKSILFFLAVLVISFGAWYIFSNKNVNKVPEKADLVFSSKACIRSIHHGKE